MRVTTAQNPEFTRSADKVFTTDNAVIVLDGASAFVPVPVSAQDYAERLGQHITDSLTAQPAADLADIVASAIGHIARELGLSPGHSPSSTVTILRQRSDHVDTLALGDSVIVLPFGVISDGRIDDLRLPERDEYRQRLASGHGYDERHAELLRELQTEQAERRNVEGGYWIAEADPNAAHHALHDTHAVADVPWAVLATDGAYNTMTHLGIDDWPSIANADDGHLAELLEHCQTWEHADDPQGQQLPRAKRHDDKAIAAVRLNPATT